MAVFEWVRMQLGREVGGFASGTALIVVAIILFLFGSALIVAAYDKAGAPHLPRWHPRRWIAPSLDFYLGLLLLVLDVVIYAFLGYTVIHEAGAVPLWFAVDSLIGGALAVLAFKHFAQDRREGPTR